jgi:hypothetical protein
MILNIMGPHMFLIMGYVVKQCRSLCWHCTGRMKKRFLTQQDMNNWHLGPELGLSYRYAQLVAMTCVCLMLGGGMPILYLIGLVSAFIFYWVDKFLFFRYYRTPARFDILLGQKASSTVYFALVLHTVFSIWILGSDAIFVAEDEFQSGSPLIQDGIQFLRRGPLPLGISSAVTQRHTIALSATLLFLIMYGIIHHVHRDLTRCTVACIQCFLCGRGWGLRNVLRCFRNEEGEDGRGDSVSFRDAKRSKLLKGLHTYNLFKNPEYMRAVRIRESDSDRRIGSGVELVECNSESETFTV